MTNTWGLFYVRIEANQFIKNILAVSDNQQALIDYAKGQRINLNSHFDPAQGVIRTTMADYYGAKTEILRDFPFLIQEVAKLA